VTPSVVRVPRRGRLRTAAGVVLVLLAALVAPVTGAAPVLAPAAATLVAPTATATDVGRPSWWVGDCDATRWGPIAASLGWAGAGSHRMGAAYLGVPVCGPRPAVDGSPDVMWGRAGWGESEWQCVELAQRFMAQVYGTAAFGANGADVVRNYSTKYGGNLVKITNGTVGRAPVPGDIVSFTTPNNPFGHVVVITSSTVDGNGNGAVTMLSQNDTLSGWRTLPVVSWQLQGFGSLTPYGWLHDPAGRGNPLGDGTFVRVTGTTDTFRIVGGAPVKVSSWQSYGSVQSVYVIEQAQFDRLRAFPSDGTYLQDSTTGEVFRTAGGAPLRVSAADSAAMPGWGSAPVWSVDHWALANNDHLRPFPADRTELCRVDTSACYLVAGGAPMYTPTADLAAVGWNPSTVTVVSADEFASYLHLRPTPADGTFLCDVAGNACYSTAGGAALLLPAADAVRMPGWSAALAIRISHWELAYHAHLPRYPRDGTVLCPLDDTTCYVVAGHAPLPIAPATAAAVPALRTAGAPRISSAEMRRPVHLAARPADGTVLQAAQNGGVFVVTAGVATFTAPPVTAAATTTAPATTAPVVVDQTAIDNAGLTGPWSHLASNPAVMRLTAPALDVTTKASVGLAWDRPVASSAVTSYTIRVRTATPTTAFTPWVVPAKWQTYKLTRLTTAIAPGTTACFSIRATNRARQVGPWSPTRCTARVVDDRAATKLSPGWRLMPSGAMYLRTGMAATKHGASWAMAAVTTDRVGVLATTCPTCGSLNVYLGKKKIGTIGLTSPALAYQQLFVLPRFAKTTDRLVLVVGSADGKVVQLDGVAISKA